VRSEVEKAVLELEGVSKIYRRSDGEVRALDGVSLAIAPGEFVAVQGPSGCGKTTLLLIAGGLLVPDGGSVRVDGRDFYAMTPNERAIFRAGAIGFVFQQYHLIPYLSVMENVLAASLALRDRDPYKAAGELIDHFGLGDRAAHVPAELSAGERQRAALARALLNRPKLLLADEPTGNLDKTNAEAVLGYLKEFAEWGGAVLLVTHSSRAASYAQRSIMLKEGKTVSDG